VALFTVYAAAIPLNERAEAPVRFVPVTITEVPTGPLAGWSVETVGAGGTDGDDPEPGVLAPPHEVIARINAKRILR